MRCSDTSTKALDNAHFALSVANIKLSVTSEDRVSKFIVNNDSIKELGELCST
jgi:hypothetical protein